MRSSQVGGLMSNHLKNLPNILQTLWYVFLVESRQRWVHKHLTIYFIVLDEIVDVFEDLSLVFFFLWLGESAGNYGFRGFINFALP